MKHLPLKFDHPIMLTCRTLGHCAKYIIRVECYRGCLWCVYIIGSKPRLYQVDTFHILLFELGEMADEVVRVGILSTASIVGKVLPGLKHGMKVVGVASRDRKKAQDFCTQHDCGEGMLYDEMLARDDVDVLYIPLPTGLRNEKIAAAIEKGKHIYSEKPMGGSVAELDSLIKACKRKGLQWMDGTMWYHSIRTGAGTRRRFGR